MHSRNPTADQKKKKQKKKKKNRWYELSCLAQRPFLLFDGDKNIELCPAFDVNCIVTINICF